MPHGQLAASRGHPQHQQVRDVGAGHEEHDEGDAPDDQGQPQPQVRPDAGRSAGPQEGPQQRGRLRILAACGRRVGARRAQDGGRGGARCFRLHAGRETHEGHEGKAPPGVAPAGRRRELKRQPDVRRTRIGAGEARRQHTDDQVGDVVEADGCPEGLRGAPEPPPRVAVADHRDRRRREVVVLGTDQPPERGTNPEEREELAGDPGDLEILGRLPPSMRHGPRIGGAGDRGKAGGIGAESRELAPVHPVRGKEQPIEASLPHPHPVNAVRILDVRRRLEEQPGQQPVHPRVETDAEGQGEDHGAGVAGVAPHHADGGARVLEQALGRPPAPGLAGQLPDARRVAEVAPGRRQRVLGGHPLGDPLVRLRREMEPDLLVELRFLPPPAPGASGGGRRPVAIWPCPPWPETPGWRPRQPRRSPRRAAAPTPGRRNAATAPLRPRAAPVATAEPRAVRDSAVSRQYYRARLPSWRHSTPLLVACLRMMTPQPGFAAQGERAPTELERLGPMGFVDEYTQEPVANGPRARAGRGRCLRDGRQAGAGREVAGARWAPAAGVQSEK